MEQKPTIFEFTSYKFEPKKKRIFFNYKQEFKDRDHLYFTETIILPEKVNIKHIPTELLEKLLQGLHFVIGVSYYKFYCATIVRHRYILTKKEADFWNAIYKNGLGEFYCKNKLDPKRSPKFSYNSKISEKNYSLQKNNKFLVALSGGKDSIVAGELLKGRGMDITAIFTETNTRTDLVDNVAKKMGVNLVKIERLLDKKVFNKHDYDGHIPISAIYGYLGIFYAILYRYSYFVVSNEYSSNFGNIKYKGFDINHQWSKSYEFEILFSNYVRDFISADVEYFSLLRPFYEIRIAELFSKYKKYFSKFSSCNKNFKLIKEKKRGLWCGHCAKCVFTFTLLSAFLSKKELLGIFKENLYQDQNLLPLFKNILGLGKMKPFDCVGTFEESKAAFITGSKNFKNNFIIRTLLPKTKLSSGAAKELFKIQPNSLIPDYLKLHGLKNALILGYGKEGKVSEKYIKKNYPNLKVGIADKKISKNYLKMQDNFDIAIKTAGMPKSLVKIPYTTATNIFFSKIKESSNKIIGVTGSKGKSTTASLIHSILKESGRKVRLVGNIGNPMLQALLKPIDKEEIFVVELSSYQLEDLPYSPHIAVVTNLFPEHLDYHKGISNYYSAKKNIINFQGSKDIFIYNPKNKISKLWAKESKSKNVAFVPENYLRNIKIPLIGEHNRENIRAAVSVAKELHASDKIIKKAIEGFKPLPHRLEFVGEFKNITFYDDAISTTPESTIMAIKSLKNVDTIFLGGQDRGYDFTQLEKVIKKYKINNAVLFPESGNKMKVKGLRILKTKNMEQAVKFGYKYTKAGKICLLSCASPSYSLWKNFEEKGGQFKESVKKFSFTPTP